VTCSNEPWPSGSGRRRRREPLSLRRCPEGRRVPSGGRLPGGWCLGLGLYAWVAKGEQGQRAAEHAEAELVAKIGTIHADSGGTYGSPRVTAELRRRGWMVNHKRVERLMAAHGIVGHRPRRRRGLTKQDTSVPPAPDLIGRLFDPDQPDRIWVSDLTYIPTDETPHVGSGQAAVGGLVANAWSSSYGTPVWRQWWSLPRSRLSRLRWAALWESPAARRRS
jgi:putative transposase